MTEDTARNIFLDCCLEGRVLGNEESEGGYWRVLGSAIVKKLGE